MKVQAEQGSYGQQDYHSDMKSYMCLIYGRWVLNCVETGTQSKSILHIIRNLQLFHLWRHPKKKRLSMLGNGDEESVREF